MDTSTVDTTDMRGALKKRKTKKVGWVVVKPVLDQLKASHAQLSAVRQECLLLVLLVNSSSRRTCNSDKTHM